MAERPRGDPESVPSNGFYEPSTTSVSACPSSASPVKSANLPSPPSKAKGRTNALPRTPKTRAMPRPPVKSTPISHKASGTDPHTTLHHFRSVRIQRYGAEMAGKFVGPMELEKF